MADNPETWHRFFQHLKPGGALLLDSYSPYGDADEWRYWVKDERRKLPEPWPASGARKRAENGEEIELRRRLAAFDPLTQVATRQIRAILWRDERPVRQEEYSMFERRYLRDELLAMLALAGFTDIAVLGDHSKNRASPESSVLVYVARKPLPSGEWGNRYPQSRSICAARAAGSVTGNRQA